MERVKKYFCIKLLAAGLLMGSLCGCGSMDVSQESASTEEVNQTAESVEIAPKISGLIVAAAPEKVDYFVGDVLETEGMVLEANFTDGTTQVIEDGYVCFPTELKQGGEQEIAVFYEGITAAFSVEVAEVVELTDIAIDSLPYTTTYMVGEFLDQEGMVLELAYNDGSREFIRQEFDCSPLKLTKPGTQEITLTYEGKSTSFTVDVVEPFVFENMEVGCICVSNEKEDFGYNVNGDMINWCLDIEFDWSEEQDAIFDPIVTSSWAHVVNGEGDWEREVGFEDAKNGVTYSEFGIMSGEYTENGKQKYMCMVFLPDDASIAGEQSVTIRVGDVEKVFSFNLIYKGDYENGTGWSVDNIRY